MKHIYQISVLFLALASMGAQARQRTELQMQALAVGQLSSTSTPAHRAPKVGVQELSQLKTSQHYRIYGNDQVGFAVISTDDTFSPVLGYSKSAYKVGNEPCGFKWWLSAVEESMQAQLAQGTAHRAARKATPVYDSIPNLLTTTWGQSAPFNALCPQVKGQLPPTGCVATAMAQVLNYFKYPSAGTGTGYYFLDGNQSRIPKDVEGVYQWDLMLDRYSGKNIPEENQKAVATLMRDCGYGSHMNYGLDGSAANDPDCAYAFCKNFGYDSLSLRLYQRLYYSDEEWMPMVYQALKNKQPVFYGGVDPDDYGGHAFVLSGINTSGMVYVNWGWNGDADGFYNIDILDATGILGRNTTMSFSERQMMITGFRMDPKPLPGAEYHTNVVLSEPFVFRPLTSNMIRLQHKNFYNMGFMPFYGVVGYYIVNIDDRIEEPVFYVMHQGPFGAGYGEVGSATNVNVKDDLYAGHYRIFFASKAVQQKEPEVCRTVGGIPYYEFEIAENGKITAGELKMAYETTAIRSVTGTRVLDDGLTRVYDTTGRLIHTAPTASFREQDVPGRGLMLIRQGQQTRKVMR